MLKEGLVPASASSKENGRKKLRLPDQYFNVANLTLVKGSARDHLFGDCLEATFPVTHVALKIRMNGNQVPMKLRNMSRLLFMARATRKKSTTITKAMKIAAVARGPV